MFDGTVFLLIISNKFSPQIYVDSVYAFEDEAEEAIHYLKEEMGPEYIFTIEAQKLQGYD